MWLGNFPVRALSIPTCCHSFLSIISGELESRLRTGVPFNNYVRELDQAKTMDELFELDATRIKVVKKMPGFGRAKRIGAALACSRCGKNYG